MGAERVYDGTMNDDDDHWPLDIRIIIGPMRNVVPGNSFSAATWPLVKVIGTFN